MPHAFSDGSSVSALQPHFPHREGVVSTEILQQIACFVAEVAPWRSHQYNFNEFRVKGWMVQQVVSLMAPIPYLGMACQPALALRWAIRMRGRSTSSLQNASCRFQKPLDVRRPVGG